MEHEDYYIEQMQREQYWEESARHQELDAFFDMAHWYVSHGFRETLYILHPQLSRLPE